MCLKTIIELSIFLSKTLVFSFLLACRVDWVLVCNIQLLVCNIQSLRASYLVCHIQISRLGVSRDHPSLLCHHSIHKPWETWVFWFVSARIIPSVPEHHPRISLCGIRATLEGKCLIFLSDFRFGLFIFCRVWSDLCSLCLNLINLRTLIISLSVVFS